MISDQAVDAALDIAYAQQGLDRTSVTRHTLREDRRTVWRMLAAAHEADTTDTPTESTHA